MRYLATPAGRHRYDPDYCYLCDIESNRVVAEQYFATRKEALAWTGRLANSYDLSTDHLFDQTQYHLEPLPRIGDHRLLSPLDFRGYIPKGE